MAKEQTIYCGSGRIIKTKHGELPKLSFSESDLKTLKQNLDKGWVNCVMKEKRNKTDGKPTHYLELDQWKPDASRQSGSVSQSHRSKDNSDDIDQSVGMPSEFDDEDIPF